MTAKGIVVAIDGPAGAGKSTVAKQLAKALDFNYVDTGAIYRCVALKAREQGLLSMQFRQSSDEDNKLKAGAWDSPLKDIIDSMMASNAIAFAWQDGEHQVFLNGKNISRDIRDEANSQAASSISSRPVVRAGLLEFQRLLGRQGGAVLEGRDVGTVVFPDAELKIYLSATPEERARRRFVELQSRGKSDTYPEVLKAMIERDRQDSQREIAPLKPADDAVELDSTHLNIDQVVEKIKDLANTRRS